MTAETDQERQTFWIEVKHANPFAVEGREYSYDYDSWFERARLKSLQYPGRPVLCSTLARTRRIYQDGAVVKDWPAWPYLGEPGPGQQW